MERGGGGGAIASRGVGVGPGTAAHSISSASRRESIKIEIFSGGRYYSCNPRIIADGTSIYIYIPIYFRAPNLLEIVW